MTHRTHNLALAAGLLAGALATPALAQEAVETNRPMTVEQQMAAQQRQIQTQQAQIDALTDQLRELSSVLSTRVDRVEAATENGRVVASNPGPRIESPNARNSMTFVGAVQTTIGAVDQDAEGSAVRLHGGTEIKRARIGLQGTAFNDYAYSVELDLATNGTVSSAARDLWVAYNGFRPWTFTVGNMKPQNGLEASFSDRSNAATFAESSMMSSMITAPGTRYVGVRASTGGSNWSTSVGLFGDDVNNNSVATPYAEGLGVHGRFTYAPIVSSDNLLHFGISGYDRSVATAAGASPATNPVNAGQLRVRAQPENTIDSGRLIDTGNLNFADNVTLVAAELAGFHGPIGFQSEWARMDVQQEGGRPDLDFAGGYFSANWFLTGESRVYDPRTGVFTRFSPRVSFDPREGTWGAWEIAARYSTLDLNSSPDLISGSTLLGVRGGEETNYTLGVNWYWNPYFRMMFNYVHADADNRTNTVPGIGGNESSTADLYALRIQQEW